MKDLKYIGENIKKARKKKSIQVPEFAALTGFSKSYIYRIEKGVKVPSLETILLFCETLEISPSELLEVDKTSEIHLKEKFIKAYLSNLTIEENQTIQEIVLVMVQNLRNINKNKEEIYAYDIHLGDNIKRIRKEQGISQAAIVKELDISESHYSHVERGDTLPATDTLFDIAECLQINIGELLNSYSKNGTLLREIFSDINMENLMDIEYKAITEVVKLISKYLVYIREHSRDTGKK